MTKYKTHVKPHIRKRNGKLVRVRGHNRNIKRRGANIIEVDDIIRRLEEEDTMRTKPAFVKLDPGQERRLARMRLERQPIGRLEVERKLDEEYEKEHSGYPYRRGRKKKHVVDEDDIYDVLGHDYDVVTSPEGEKRIFLEEPPYVEDIVGYEHALGKPIEKPRKKSGKHGDNDT